MVTICRTESGIEYLIRVLKQKKSILTRAYFWKIPHTDPSQEDISLKIGRYRDRGVEPEVLESDDPKSELTLEHDEFLELIDFLSENYEPFRKGVRRYIPLDDSLGEGAIGDLKAIFARPDRKELLDFIARNDILPDDLVVGLESQARVSAVREFEHMLAQDLVQQRWQVWFKRNAWVLGTEFVRVLEERDVDTANITDYLMQAYDGFLDIVEIKRPGGSLHFWADARDHGNYVPSTDLTKAVTQATRYIYELELEANSSKSLARMGNVRTVKPRCTLIFGRSNDWNGDQREAYRILNASYHSLSILTYDHVLSRAKRILDMKEAS